MGHLGRDPEIRYMGNGNQVANFSMATTEQWRDKAGERVTRTEWHSITLYRRLAEVAGQYLKKGSMVYIEGRIQTRKYTGKDGVERTAYDIIGSELKMIGSRGGDHGGSDPQDHRAPTPAAPRRESVAAPIVDDLDDDIPF